MTRFKLKENFEWMAAPDFQVINTGKNTITIRGIAVKKGDISRNRRKYVDEELARAARTWIGKPVTINHAPWDNNHPMYDGRKVAGNVRWMEYNKGNMEYQIDIKKQPYVDLLRTKSVEVEGVSIEADYIYNRCSRCGKNFYTQEEFEHHMVNEEFIRNFNYEPHQMLGRAVSLVLSPEEPGVSGNPIELMETYQRPQFKGFSQLLETVTIYEKERQKHLKKSKVKETEKTKPKPVPYKVRLALGEQDEHGCKENEHYVEGKGCVPNEPATEQEDHGCKEDEVWDKEQEKCVAKVTEQDDPTQTDKCPEGEHRDAETGECVPDPVEPVTEQEAVPSEPSTEPLKCEDGWHLENDMCIPDDIQDVTPTPSPVAEQVEAEPQPPIPEQPTQAPCEEGQHRDEATGLCIANVEAPVGDALGGQSALEFKVALPPLMSLGEFGGTQYTSQEDCESKNQDKGDPAAYCASISRKAHGETLKESWRKAYPLLEGLDAKSWVRDAKIATSVNKVNKAVAKTVVHFPKVMEALKKNYESKMNLQNLNQTANIKALVKHVNKLGASDKSQDRHFHDDLKKVAEIASKLLGVQNKFFVEKLTSLATSLAKEKRESLKTKKQLNTLNPAFNKKLGELQKQIVKSNEALDYNTAEIHKKLEVLETLEAQNKKNYETLLAAAETVMKKQKGEIKSLEQRVKEQEDDAKQCGENEHYDEEKKQCVPNEATETEKQLKEMITRVENLESKQKGKFKGHEGPVKGEGKGESDLVDESPYKAK